MADSDPLATLSSEQLEAARKHYGDDEIRRYLLQQQSDISYRNQASGGAAAGGPPAPKTNWEGVDVESGAPAWDRFLAGFRSGPEGRTSFYKKRYGEGRVRTSPGGELEYSPEPGKWARVDEEGFSAKDLADLGGDIPELIGMMAAPALRAVTGLKGLMEGSKAARAATTMGGGAAAGNIARQTVSQTLPGDESVSISDPFKAAAGAEAVNLYNKVSPGLNAARAVSNSEKFIESYLQKRLANPETAAHIREGLELSQKTGVPLNLAEITRDPLLKTFLGFAHRSSAGQPLAMKEAAEKQSAALAMFNRIMGELSGPAGFENSNYAQAATEAARRALADVNNSLNRGAYNFLDRPEAAIPNIPLTNRTTYLEGLAQRYRSMGEASQLAKAKEIERLLQGVPTTPTGERMGNVRLVQQLLQESGEEGFGRLPEKEFPMLAALQGTKESRDLWAATNKDLVAAAEKDPLARRLLKERKATGDLLTTREGLEKLPLMAFMNSKGMLGEAMKGGTPAGADKIFPHLMAGIKSGSISPGELGNMMQVMTVTSPKFADQFAHEVLGQAIKAGMTEKGFRASEAVKALPSMPYMEAIYKDLWNKGTKTRGMQMSVDLQMLMRALDRIDKFGLGIPESPATQLTSLGGKLAGGQFGAASKQALAQFVLPQVVARMSYSPEIRQKLLDYVMKGSTEEAPSFMGSFLKNTLPAVLYEAGSSAQQRNQAGFGKQ